MTVVQIFSLAVCIKRVRNCLVLIIRKIVCSIVVEVVTVSLRLSCKWLVCLLRRWFLHWIRFFVCESHEWWQYLWLFLNCFSKCRSWLAFRHIYFINTILFDLTFGIVTVKAVILFVVLIHSETVALLSWQITISYLSWNRSWFPNRSWSYLLWYFAYGLLFEGRDRFLIKIR